MSGKFSEADRAKIHKQLDDMLDLAGVDGMIFTMAIFHADGVKTFQYGKGDIDVDDRVATSLKMLIDQCKTHGTPNGLAMIRPLRACLRFLEELHYESEKRMVGHA